MTMHVLAIISTECSLSLLQLFRLGPSFNYTPKETCYHNIVIIIQYRNQRSDTMGLALATLLTWFSKYLRSSSRFSIDSYSKTYSWKVDKLISALTCTSIIGAVSWCN